MMGHAVISCAKRRGENGNGAGGARAKWRRKKGCDCTDDRHGGEWWGAQRLTAHGDGGGRRRSVAAGDHTRRGGVQYGGLQWAGFSGPNHKEQYGFSFIQKYLNIFELIRLKDRPPLLDFFK
jgi:hypothetical protein